MDFKYDVFLSYRHKPLDNEITQKTFNLLESYKLPKSLQGRGYSGVKRAFRDTEELAVSRILSTTIEEALRSTNCLVVVCSPDTPSSEWVDREVATFIELGRAEKIFPLLIAGDREASFPPTLKTIPDIDRRIIDVRSEGNDPGDIMKNAKTALLRVIAEVAGCSHRELLREDKLARTRRAIAKRGGAAAIVAVVFAVSAGLWMLAERYRETAQSEQAASMSMLELLTYELPSKLVELPGSYRTVSGILEENAAQIITILEMTEDKSSVSLEIAANYEKLTTARITLGEYKRAAESQKLALDIYESYYNAGDDSFLPSLASGWNNLGKVRDATGDYTGAKEAYDRAMTLGELLLENDSSYEARYNHAIYIGNSGTVTYMYGDFVEAEKLLLRSCESLTELREEGGAAILGTLSVNSRNLSNIYLQLARYSEAEQWLLIASEASDELFERIPNRTNLGTLLEIRVALATLYTNEGRFDEALPYYELAISSQEQLALDEDNMDAQTALGVLYNNYGLLLNMTGDFKGANEWYLKNAQQQEKISARLGTPVAQATCARAYYNVAENMFKSGEYADSRAYFERCLELYEPVSLELGSYHRSEYLARYAYYEIIYGGDLLSALYSAAEAVDLQPESSFIMYNFAYALMYNELYDACDQVLTTLAGRSEGEIINIRLDFEALTRAGMYVEYMDDALLLMENVANG